MSFVVSVFPVPAGPAGAPPMFIPVQFKPFKYLAQVIQARHKGAHVITGPRATYISNNGELITAADQTTSRATMFFNCQNK